MAPYYGLGSVEAILDDLYAQIDAIPSVKTVEWQRAKDMGANR